MRRRRFDHLATELSLALGEPVPRYPLWLELHGCGADPEDLSREAALAFCGAPLERFLAARRLRLTPRGRRALERSVRRYDPGVVTPCEHLERISDA